MISRVAEACFWMFRYMERLENVARLLDVNLLLVLDANLRDQERWRPVLIVAGEEPRFLERFSAAEADKAERVQDYMVFDEQNPVSILSSLRWARENARSIRETISLEMWEALNSFWLWLGEAGRRRFTRDRHDFYSRVKEQCALFHGLTHNTVMHNEPFNFMRLGMLLERANQTARVLDVKYHALGPTSAERESLAESAQWLALLRSCSGYESFFKQAGAQLTGTAIAAFLMLEPDFPRSVLYCVSRAVNFMNRVRGKDNPMGERSAATLSALHRELEQATIGKIVAVEAGIHKQCTRIVQATADICDAISTDFFDPPLPRMTEFMTRGELAQQA
ncbi:MAG: alpha-E domain-containing protein [Planctomycetaceae bacterium]|nr:hypothetical protein [Planctomycetota bacterium]MCQ3950895.1 alpha-E domain-containing protein [Planctomycetota bacterium]NUO16702.1 alpha-E domain-containing protein [Planctomycetaceae bacterium]GIK53976.1 MAG: hypothetical protein BroJett014_29490 [Planctomycetota bacterium]HRJ78777.1 alpha-E domain-containing protein [Planctomycetota bacterium]